MLASLGDRVWVDSNANGVQDAGEVGKAGVTVELYTCVGDMPDTLVATQVTDAGGNYNFAGLDPGRVHRQVHRRRRLGALDRQRGRRRLRFGRGCGRTDRLLHAERRADRDQRRCGLYEKAEIGDRVWLDANKNGIQDAGEAGVSECDRQARRCGRQRRGHGHHGCQRQLPVRRAHAGPVPGRLRPGHAAGRLCGDDQGRRGQHRHERLGCQPGHGETTYTTLESGESDLSWDMGIVATPARIGDRVWLDANANGVQDAGEAGVSGVTIELQDAGGTVIGSTTTDASSNYFFDVEPGTFDRGDGPRLRGDGPEPGRQRSDRQRHRPGHRDERHGDGGGGRDQPQPRRGHLRDRQPGDRVWDSNANGVQDAGEVGKAIGRALHPRTCPYAGGRRSSGGNYNFAGLTPGEYIVKFIAADGRCSTANVGGDAFDSDAGADGLTGC